MENASLDDPNEEIITSQKTNYRKLDAWFDQFYTLHVPFN